MDIIDRITRWVQRNYIHENSHMNKEENFNYLKSYVVLWLLSTLFIAIILIVYILEKIKI